MRRFLLLLLTIAMISCQVELPQPQKERLVKVQDWQYELISDCECRFLRQEGNEVYLAVTYEAMICLINTLREDGK